MSVPGYYDLDDEMNTSNGFGVALPPATIQNQQLAREEAAAAARIDDGANRANRLLGNLTSPIRLDSAPTLVERANEIDLRALEQAQISEVDEGGLTLPPAAAANRINRIASHLIAPSQSKESDSLARKIAESAPDLDAQEQIKALDARIQAFKNLEEELVPTLTGLKDVETKLQQGPLSFEQMANLPVPRMPDAALEAVKKVCEQEKLINQKIKDHIKKVQEHQETIKKLQKLTGLLSKYKEGEEISPEMRNAFKELHDQKIELGLGDEKALTKEKAGDIKALIRDHQETLRTNIQILFTTEIQVLIQTITSLIDIAKTIHQTDTSTKRGMLQRMVTR